MSEAPKTLRPPWRGEASEVIARDAELMARSYRRPYPLVVKSVEGCLVEDLNGNRYIDFTAGYGALPLGGRHPAVLDAIKRQAERLPAYSLRAAYSGLVLELLERLSKIAPVRGDVRALLANSGSEAVEAALTALRWHTGKRLLIGFLGAHHGSTQGALSLSADTAGRRRAALTLEAVHAPYPYCYRCPMGLGAEDCGLRCAGYLEEWVLGRVAPPETAAAAVLEPIQVEAGAVVPPRGYHERVSKTLKRLGVRLLLDEAYTAPGRCGRWFAIELWGVDADAVCLGPPLASGLPLGVVLARGELLDLEPGQHESTSGGCQLSLAAAIATLDAMRDEGLVERAERLGRGVLRRLQDLREDFEAIGEVRGAGLLIGVELVEERESRAPAPKTAQTVVEECFRLGLLTRRAGQTVILTPPLNIEEEYLEKGLEIFETALSEATS